MLNKIFIPIWQSDSYYLNLNNKILKLEKYSFGHLLPNKIGIGDIYYAPLSFIIGFL